MFLTLVFAALLQVPSVPPGWTASNSQPLLEASGPSQSVKIPVALWDADANPVAPDVSFSYSVTASDKDTFSCRQAECDSTNDGDATVSAGSWIFGIPSSEGHRDMPMEFILGRSQVRE